MPESRDKRRRSDLDLFVLALIEDGVSTPYTFQKSAALSPGATIPAIQRLLKSGFVRQEKPGLRGRADHQITAAGKKHLANGWRPLIDEGPSGDLNADLRVALLALLVGGQRQLAVNFLHQAAEKIRHSMQEATRDSASDALSPLARLYRELRSQSEKTLLKAQSAAITATADSLPRGSARERKSKARMVLAKDAQQRDKRP